MAKIKTNKDVYDYGAIAHYTKNYNELTELPTINGVELKGDQVLSDFIRLGDNDLAFTSEGHSVYHKPHLMGYSPVQPKIYRIMVSKTGHILSIGTPMTIHYGAAKPDDSLGIDGDFYFRKSDE